MTRRRRTTYNQTRFVEAAFVALGIAALATCFVAAMLGIGAAM